MNLSVEWLWGFLLVFTRAGAMISLAPVFGSRTVPVSIKVAFSAVIALGLSPIVQSSVGAPPADFIPLALRIASEALTGLVMGFAVNTIVSAAMIAGEILDIKMGFNAIQILNPISSVPTAILAQFHYMLSMVLFAMIDGHHLLLIGLARSYEVSHTVLSTSSLAQANLSIIGAMAAETLMLAIQIAAPAGGVLLVVDAAMAAVARAVPQAPVWLLSMPAKIAIGFIALAASLPTLVWAVMRMSDISKRFLESLMRLWG